MEKMLMDWGGPKAWVKKMAVQYRRRDYLFEMKTIGATIVGKHEEDGDYLVGLELEMANEKGEIATKGYGSG